MFTGSAQRLLPNDAEEIIWSAAPTPFDETGELEEADLERLVEQHLRLGISCLFLAGTTGEGPFMPNGQQAALTQSVRRVAGDRMTLAVQVSDTSAARVRDNMARVRDAGADAVVISPPWLERFAHRDFLRRYFFESIEAAPLPVGLYVLGSPPNSPLDLSLWAELAEHPNVRLIKDSSVSDDYAHAFAAIRKKRSDLLLLTGNEFDVLTPRAQGYDGAILGTGILIGGFIRRALYAWAKGNQESAEAWQARSNEFLWDLFGRDIRLWLGGLKYALVRLGIFSTPFMHLVYTLSDADRARIDAALDRELDILCPGVGLAQELS